MDTTTDSHTIVSIDKIGYAIISALSDAANKNKKIIGTTDTSIRANSHEDSIRTTHSADENQHISKPE